mgnify:FL=1
MTVETEGDTQSEVIKLAVTNNELKHLSESMNRLEAKFDKAILGFVTHEKLNDVERAFNAKHSVHSEKIAGLEDWSKWAIRVILLLVASAIGGVIFVTK